MEFKELQKDMRVCYLGGGTGILVSGIVWSVSSIVAIYSTKEVSILTFFLGGLLIYPFGIISTRLFKRTSKHLKGNPFPIWRMKVPQSFLLGFLWPTQYFRWWKNGSIRSCSCSLVRDIWCSKRFMGLKYSGHWGFC